MTTTLVGCPSCGKELRVSATSVGKQLRCPWCKTTFTSSAPVAVPPPAITPTPPVAMLVQTQPTPAPLAVVPVEEPARASGPNRAVILASLIGGLLLLGGAAVGMALFLSGKEEEPQASVDPSPNLPASGKTSTPSDTQPGNLTPWLRYDRPDQTPDAGARQDTHDTTVQQPASPRSALPPDLQKQVDEAIDRGVQYLKNSPLANRGWQQRGVGYAALGGLTLLECGVNPIDPVVVEAAIHIRDNMHRLTNTYEIGLAILFFDKLGDRADEKHIQTLAMRLIAGQKQDGGWRYTCLPLSSDEEKQLLAVLRQTRPRSLNDLVVVGPDGRLQGLTALQRAPGDKLGASSPVDEKDLEGTAELTRIQDSLPPRLKRIPSLTPPKEGSFGLRMADSDNSCTQFAVLGLWAAGRHGVHAERALSMVVTRFRSSQLEDGGWAYAYTPQRRRRGATPPMTCSGLLGLAVGHGLTADKHADAAKKQDPEVLDAFEYLESHIGTGVRGRINMYYLWSVERVAVLYGLDRIRGKDWYRWGVELILNSQAPDGHWFERGYHGSADHTDTCFALLFLRRANFTSDLSRKLESLIEIKQLQ